MKNPGDAPATPINDTQPKISYPSFYLDAEKAEEFLQGTPVELGDTVTATVTLKVTSLRQDQGGASVGFDATALDNIASAKGGVASGGDEPPPGDEEASAATTKPVADAEPPAEEDAEEQKTLGYKRPKAKKEAPKLSAKDLMD